MQKSLYGFVVALSILAGTAHAKKTSPIAPTLASSISATVDFNTEQLPPSIPILNGTVKIQLSHSFEIPSNVENAIGEDTTISLLLMTLNPGDDPNFSNGDKSFNINTELDGFVGGGIVDLPVSVKGKWNNGKMSITMKISQKLKNIPVAVPITVAAQQLVASTGIGVTKSVSAETRAGENVISLGTKIEDPSISTYEVISHMAADVQMITMEGATAEGAQLTGAKQIIDSEFYVAPILP